MALDCGFGASVVVALEAETHVDPGDAFENGLEGTSDEVFGAVFSFSPIHTTLCG